MEKLRSFVAHRTGQFEKRLIVIALYVIAGGVCSFSRILGRPCSAGVSLAVISGDNILYVTAGSALGYAFTGGITQGMIQICSMLMIAGLRFVLPLDRLTLFGRKNAPLFTSILTSATLILFGSVMSVTKHTDALTASLTMIDALLCGCTVYSALSVMKNRQFGAAIDTNGVNALYAAVLYVMCICALTSVQLGVVNPGRAAGCLCVLFAVRKSHKTGGAVVGALTTCGVLMCAPLLGRNTLLLATSGLICGAFFTFSQIAAVGVFVFTSVLSLAALGVNSDTFPMLADLMLASLAFLAIPASSVRKLAAYINAFSSPVDSVSRAASSKLSFASGTIGEIRSQLTQVSRAIEKRAKASSLREDVIAFACEQCVYRSACPENSQLRWSLGKLERICAKFNCVSDSDVEESLAHCRRPAYLAQVFNKHYCERVEEKAGEMQMKELRGLLSEQLSSMQDMLADLSVKVGQVRNGDAELSDSVRSAFDRLGYPNASACVYTDENMCVHAEVYLTSELETDAARVTAAVSAAAGCELDLPSVFTAKGITRLSFCEKPAYCAEIATFSASRSDGCSGDTCEVFNAGASERYVILSDGMGTGKRARLDSVFTVSLVSRLINCGISMVTAHKMINSMLRVKGWEESFATLDILRLDLGSGSARMLKSGAAPSYLVRDGGLKILSSDAFPAGILPACAPDIADLKLFDGDIILLASDGADEECAKMLCTLAAKETSAESICNKLGGFCLDKCSGSPLDDITLIVVKITKQDPND